jgi:hypothetical protein
MPTASKPRLVALCTVALLLFLFLLRAFFADMDSLDFPFTVEIDRTPIAKVSNDNKDSRVQAKTGSDAAVFTLKNSRLQCGDWILGRSTSEDRSLLPKQVFWFKASDDADPSVQPVAAHQDGESHELKFNNSA